MSFKYYLSSDKIWIDYRDYTRSDLANSPAKLHISIDPKCFLAVKFPLIRLLEAAVISGVITGFKFANWDVILKDINDYEKLGATISARDLMVKKDRQRYQHLSFTVYLHEKIALVDFTKVAILCGKIQTVLKGITPGESIYYCESDIFEWVSFRYPNIGFRNASIGDQYIYAFDPRAKNVREGGLASPYFKAIDNASFLLDQLKIDGFIEDAKIVQQMTEHRSELQQAFIYQLEKESKEDSEPDKFIETQLQRIINREGSVGKILNPDPDSKVCDTKLWKECLQVMQSITPDKRKNGFTFHHAIAQSGNAELGREFLDDYALTRVDSDDVSVIDTFIKRGQHKAFDEVLSHLKERKAISEDLLSYSRTARKFSPAHYAAVNEKSGMESMRILIKHQANVEQEDEIGWAPVHYALYCGNIGVLQLLVQYGVSFSFMINMDFLKDFDEQLRFDQALGNEKLLKKPNDPLCYTVKLLTMLPDAKKLIPTTLVGDIRKKENEIVALFFMMLDENSFYEQEKIIWQVENNKNAFANIFNQTVEQHQLFKEYKVAIHCHNNPKECMLMLLAMNGPRKPFMTPAVLEKIQAERSRLVEEFIKHAESVANVAERKELVNQVINAKNEFGKILQIPVNALKFQFAGFSSIEKIAEHFKNLEKLVSAAMPAKVSINPAA